MILRPAASASSGDLLKMQSFGVTADLLSQELQGCSPAPRDSTRPYKISYSPHPTALEAQLVPNEAFPK